MRCEREREESNKRPGDGGLGQKETRIRHCARLSNEKN
jgi:hypothetical protein